MTGPAAATSDRAGFWRMTAQLVARTTTVLVLLTLAYYVLPARSPAAGVPVAVRFAGGAVAIAAVFLVARNLKSARRRMPAALAAAEMLLAALYVLILVFSQTYYLMGIWTDQFSGLHTKTDALYFTVTVVATVGFGDIHASGTAARAVVTAQMLFDVIYIGTALRLLTQRGLGPTGRVGSGASAVSRDEGHD